MALGNRHTDNPNLTRASRRPIQTPGGALGKEAQKKFEATSSLTHVLSLSGSWGVSSSDRWGHGGPGTAGSSGPQHAGLSLWVWVEAGQGRSATAEELGLQGTFVSVAFAGVGGYQPTLTLPEQSMG